MTIYNNVAIADPSAKNRRDNSDEYYETVLLDEQLPHESEGDQEKNLSFPKLHPSPKGFPVDETVTVPITQEKNEYLVDDRKYAQEQDLKADVEVFHESSALDFETSREFVKEHHYKTIITTENTWTDPVTGRVHLYEKQPRTATRIV